MKIRILIGDRDDPDYEFLQNVYKNGTVRISLEVDVVGSELAIDDMEAEVIYESGANVILATTDRDGIMSNDGFLIASNDITGDLREVPYGTPVWLMDGDRVVSKMYYKEAIRTAYDAYRIKAMSGVGLLDNVQHLGGVYNGITFADLIEEIIGDVLTYSIEDDVAEIPIYGWLPIATARDNLHQLLFAENVCLTKDEDGEIVFSYLYADESAPEIPPERVFIGGEVEYPALASAVEITEHAFVQTALDEEETLYDNTEGEVAAALRIEFREPMHSLVATGLTIDESGANYAIVTGTGVLTGKKYTHQRQILRRERSGAAVENVMAIDDATLVSFWNSLNVLDRCYAFYAGRSVVHTDVVLDGESAGRQVVIVDPHGEETVGLISKLDEKISTIIRASMELIADYVPTGQGNNFTTMQILTGDGNWTVPDGVTRARITLIGGGAGGEAGGAGSAGSLSAPGSGGAAGSGGLPGKVFTVTRENLVPGSQIAFACGTGGASGQSGTDTTFGSYSSASGVAPDNGFINLLTGEVYARQGEDGCRGGQGGAENSRPMVYWQGQSWQAGAQGYAASGMFNHAAGGYGGGAAVGRDGGAGNNAWNDQDGYPHGGAGGVGATPVTGADASNYGDGGNGGHGGGGGGRGGDCTLYQYSGSGGTAGAGSNGGRGGAGCVILMI